MEHHEDVTPVDNRKTTAMSWTGASSDADYDALKGNEVRTNDDHLIGTVAAIYHPSEGNEPAPGSHYLLIEPSHLTSPGATEPLYMPETAIGAVTADGIQIPWTRDEVANEGWSSKPALIDRFRRT
jgi:hypothetical protein